MAATDVILGFLVQFNGVVGNGMPLFVSVRAFGDLLQKQFTILHSVVYLFIFECAVDYLYSGEQECQAVDG